MTAEFNKNENSRTVPTGFMGLDEKFGMRRGDLIIIAGRPGVGTTAFVTNIASFLAVENKLSVHIFNLGLPKDEFVRRMLCSYAMIDECNVRNGVLSKADWSKLIKAATKLSRSPIYHDCSPMVKTSKLIDDVRRLKEEHNTQIVIIDYLQLTEDGVNDKGNMPKICQKLKKAALELDIPVLCVSRLAMNINKLPLSQPTYNDFCASVGMDETADMAILLHRKQSYDPIPPFEEAVKAIVIKNREGPTGSVHFKFTGSYMKFTDNSGTY